MKTGPGTSSSSARQYIWVAISVLLALGMTTSIIDLLGTSDAEKKLAFETQQRVIIDSKTGAVSGADRPRAAATVTAPEKPAADFEVGEESEVPPTPAGEEEASVVEEPEPTEAAPTAAPTTEGDAPKVEESQPVTPQAVTSQDNAPELATTPVMSDIPKVERTKDSLVLAPAPEVSEITEQGALPKRGAGENATPALIYSRNFKRDDDVATLHFVIVGLGFGSDTLGLALDLPPQVSFAFSPYGDSLTEQLEAARNGGHEAWIQLPVQTTNYPQDDPGPLGLIATLNSNAFDARLKKMLMAMPGIVGVVFPIDETLSESATIYQDLLKQLNERGLIAVLSNPKSGLKQLSEDKDLRKITAKTDLILDDVPNDAVIKSKLAGLMDQTKERRQMVVLLHARPQTMILVKDWLKRTKYEGVELAPLSATILRPAKMLTPDDVEAAPKPAAAEGGHGGGEKKEGDEKAKPAEEAAHGGGH